MLYRYYLEILYQDRLIKFYQSMQKADSKTTCSLSDPNSETFHYKCDHEHTTGCDDCTLVVRTLLEVTKEFECCSFNKNIPKDIAKETYFEINQSKMNLSAWKSH
ncbi:hypothetical protein MHBO_004840, partial [Bonamia ostreae]